MIGGVEKTTDAAGEAVFYLIDGKTYVIGAYKARRIVRSRDVTISDTTSRWNNGLNKLVLPDS